MSSTPRDRLRHAQPATEEEATALSVKLNRALVALYPLEEVVRDGAAGSSSAQRPPIVSDGVYFKLFRQVDHLRTGAVKYSDFLNMVRHGLCVPKKKATDSRIASAWRYIDKPGKGVISTAGFLKLMRLGWPAFVRAQAQRNRKAPTWDKTCHVNTKRDGPVWVENLVSANERQNELNEAARGRWEAFRDARVLDNARVEAHEQLLQHGRGGVAW